MSERRFTDKPELNPQAVRSLPADHPAMKENRTLFPSTVVTVTKEEPQRLLVSGRENRKLGATVMKGAFKGYGIYGLSLEERATCPVSCEARGYCYGNGMQMARRHRIGDADVFYDRLAMEICELLEREKGLLIRLHVLGDFPDPEYVAFWKDVLDEHPNVAIYGYTHWLKDSEVAAAIESVKSVHKHRFRIRWSSRFPVQDGATIITEIPKEARTQSGLVCPAQTDDTACCATCGLCWDISFASDTIAFIKHGPKSADAELAAVANEATPPQPQPTRSDAAALIEAPGETRACEPLNLSGLTPAPVPDKRPEFRFVAPGSLIIEGRYQRSLSKASLRLIRKIVSEFDWAKFKPPVVAETQQGLFVIDGQHSAIAAATHGGIDEIPVIIVPASIMHKRASAFVAHNRDRISMTPLQVFHAEIVAGDPIATQILKLVYECGGDIPRSNPIAGTEKPGQFLCVNDLRSLLNTEDAFTLKLVVRICVKSQIKKIPQIIVRALRLIYTEDYFIPLAEIGEDRIAAALAKVEDIDARAKALATDTNQTPRRACALLIAKAAGIDLEKEAALAAREAAA